MLFLPKHQEAKLTPSDMAVSLKDHCAAPKTSSYLLPGQRKSKDISLLLLSLQEVSKCQINLFPLPTQP